VQVGPFLVGSLHHRPGRFGANGNATRFVMIEEICAEVPHSDFGFLAVDEILEMISDENLHVFEA
jgi:hypothetical protein